LHASVDSYIQEARDLLSSDASSTDIMKVAITLSIKENEKEKELMKREAETALSIKENYYLKKLSILSLRYTINTND